MSPNRRQILHATGAALVPTLIAGCVSAPMNRNRGSRDPEPNGNSAVTTDTSDSTEAFPTPPAPSDDPVRRFTRDNTAFGLDLLDYLTADDKGGGAQENLLISPFSIGVALAMTYAGAYGETRKQIRSTLRFELAGESLHPAIRETRTSMTSRQGVSSYRPRPVGTATPDPGSLTPFQLLEANAVWGQQGLPWLDAYLNLLEEQYGAGLQTVDFKTQFEQARKTVNAWVADRTKGKVPDLLPPGSLTRLTRLVLVNAVYFRSRWANVFDPDDTERRSFTSLDGSTQELPMMTQTERFPYARVRGHQVVELPYVAEDLGMVVILPAEGSFERFRENLTTDRLLSLLERVSEREGTIILPKVSFRSGFTLRKALSDLGMPIAFRDAADFRQMTEGDGGRDLLIDNVHHKTFIGVDEKGTEAAAATGVTIRTVTRRVTEDEPFEMVVDRPFLFLIRDRQTGAVLFLGNVVDGGGGEPS